MTADRINGFSSSASTPAEEYKQARQKIKLIEAQLQLEALQRVQSGRRRIQESQAAWEWIDGYNEVVDRLRGPERDLVLPVSTASDRRYGANWPFWRTLLEHSRLRASARLLHGLSTFAQGAINALTSYTIGTGYTVEVSASEDEKTSSALLSAVREAVKDFEQENSWGQLQQELFLRSRRDGEYLLRAFDPGDGMLHVRTVGPEHIGEPPGSDPHEWSFGVHTDTEDRQKVLGYWVALDGNWGNGEEVSADDLLHVKVNVDAEIKRGLTDFCFDTYDTLKSGQRLIESLAEGSAIQASIALLRQHDQSSATQVSEFVRGLADYSEPIGATSGERNVQRFTPGTIVDAPKGWNFVVPPFASNAQGFVAVVQAVLRSVAVRWNAPEWIISGDASNNNYASSITAESPFVRSCKRWQAFYGAGFERVLWRALRARCDAGKLRADGRVWEFDEVRRAVSVTLNPPTLETRNIQEEASVNTTYLSAGVKSPQTICGELGLDYEKESANLAEHQEKTGGGAALGGMLGGMGGDDGDMADLFGGSMQEAMVRKKDKLGRNICYDDGKRVSCGPSRDQAGKGKAGEPVQGAIAHWRRIYQGGNITPAHVDEFAAALGELSVKELGDLKKRMMVRAGGRKAEMARKIAERLLDGAKKLPPPEEETPLKPEPEPEPEPVKQEVQPAEPEPATEPEPAKKKTASVDEYADLLVDTINDGDRGYKAKLWTKGGRTRVYVRDSKGREVGHIEIQPGGAEVLVNRAKGYFSDLLPDIDIVADEDLEPEVTQKSPQPVAQSKGPEKQPEPWAMSRKEYADIFPTESAANLALSGHRDKVVGAILRGEKVPQHVLDDYPGIAQETLQQKQEDDHRKAEHARVQAANDDAIARAKSASAERRQRQSDEDKAERLERSRNAPDNSQKEPWEVTQRDYTFGDRSLRSKHKDEVRAALQSGKPVPASVLADYPDLQPSQSGARASAQSKEPEKQTSTPSTPEQRRKLWDKASKVERDFDSGAPATIKDLRRLAPEMSREQFDRAILDLQKDGHVQLNRVSPEELKMFRPDEIAHWVKDEKGNYWNAMVGQKEPPQADWQSKEKQWSFDQKAKDDVLSAAEKVSPGGGAFSVRELRAKMPHLDKQEFDALLFQMHKDGLVHLQRDNFPDSFSDEHRAGLVSDPDGQFYGVVTVAQPEKPAKQGAEPAKAKPDSGPAKSTFTDQDLADVIHSVSNHPENKRLGLPVKVHDVVDEIQRQSPGASMKSIHDALIRLQKEDKLTLQTVQDPRLEPRVGEMIPGPKGPLGYIQARPTFTGKQREVTPGKPPTHSSSSGGAHRDILNLGHFAGVRQADMRALQSAKTPDEVLAAMAGVDGDFLDSLTDRGVVTHNEVTRIAQRAMAATGSDRARLLDASVKAAERTAKELRANDRPQKADYYEKAVMPYLKSLKQGSGQPATSKPSQQGSPATAEHRSKLASAFKKLDRNGDNMVSLADLKDETGMDIPTLHAAVQQLMRDGIMSGSGLEGRFGASKRELDAVIHDRSEHGIGYVAVRPERMEDFLKLIGKK